MKLDVDSNFFSRYNEKSFYWAGFLAADGCLTHGDSIRIYQSDRVLIKKFLKDIKSKHAVQKRTYESRKGKSKDSYCASIRDKKIYDDLQKFGLSVRKSKTLKMPKWLREHELVHHFIRGYFDGDGSAFLNKQQKTIKFRGTPSFLRSVNKIIKSNINISTKAKISVDSNCGSLRYAGNNLVPIIGEYLYKNATVFMSRKRKIIFQKNKIKKVIK